MMQAGYFIAAAFLAVLIVAFQQLRQPKPLEAKRHRARVVYVIECVFRGDPASDSDNIRPPIPI